MYTLNSESSGLNFASAIISRTLSTPLLLAASISIGVPLPLFNSWANIRAFVVFPVPAPPVNK